MRHHPLSALAATLALATALGLAPASAWAQSRVDGRMVVLNGQPLDAVVSSKVAALTSEASSNSFSWLNAVPSLTGSKRDYTHMASSSAPGFGEVLTYISSSPAGESVDYDVALASWMHMVPGAAATGYAGNFLTTIDFETVTSYATGVEINFGNGSTYNFGDDPNAKPAGAGAGPYASIESLYLGPGLGRIAAMLSFAGPDTGQLANRAIHFARGDYIKQFEIQASSNAPTHDRVDGGQVIGFDTSGAAAMTYAMILGNGQKIAAPASPGSATLVSLARLDSANALHLGEGAQKVTVGGPLQLSGGLADSSPGTATSVTINGGQTIGVDTSGASAMNYSMIMGNGQRIAAVASQGGTTLVGVARLDNANILHLGEGTQNVTVGGTLLLSGGVLDASPGSGTSVTISGGQTVGINTSGATAMTYAMIVGNGQRIAAPLAPNSGTLVDLVRLDVNGVLRFGLNATQVSIDAPLSTQGVAAVSCAAGQVNPATMVVTNGVVTHC